MWLPVGSVSFNLYHPCLCDYRISTYIGPTWSGIYAVNIQEGDPLMDMTHACLTQASAESKGDALWPPFPCFEMCCLSGQVGGSQWAERTDGINNGCGPPNSTWRHGYFLKSTIDMRLEKHIDRWHQQFLKSTWDMGIIKPIQIANIHETNIFVSGMTLKTDIRRSKTLTRKK